MNVSYKLFCIKKMKDSKVFLKIKSCTQIILCVNKCVDCVHIWLMVIGPIHMYFYM
jgi:hypothetical protein